MSSQFIQTKTQAELETIFKKDLKTGVGRSIKHDSADKQVSGEAQYIDDKLEFPNQLHVYARMSDRAHAKILSIDTSPCYEFDGVAIAITAKDVPGNLDIGPVVSGDPLLADDLVEYYGQAVLAVAANDHETARKAAMAAVIEYEDLSQYFVLKKPLRKNTLS
ncbi:Xanthine dehydrogenase [Marinomonas sp. MED121]|uniref:xanthine dehydrogenase n=1 Tax=Marinomonas sp. MED121 TaxID=314277 RepID=UPI0000690F99|nr:Xanthine dehydrogenase [Marinomonas sp. MED121]